MRIIAGEFRGRRLKQPADRRVRPTVDRVREAWFNIIEPSLPGARALDLFAGSGALGLEALSRGAVHVDFVELSKPSLAALRANIAALAVESRVRVHRRDALRFARRLAGGSYDVALADPPYPTDQAARLLGIFRERPFARILGIEHSASLTLTGDETRRYGSIALTFCYGP
ncbi:MAG: 16S rRNA (guanine(966)-N(2))-methyltransferase RsmD [Gemmatimonadales bacterium]|nr:16S rRNA (guanine(966)-N(2))-methyltransferase RsmD [Gemmatimonadales bacterium]NIN12207.1 16S rRNA (guanine(966)-N(2))-methyltransferase RsmD [Gemmatimonadales bacterium]NIN50622.1 16S rRNA (guanine(966)-N(2))-methyltransferase RsmD [Gemmatimonadales bacterium]NIP08086.1 16S rRNA (guanine(966)-N(2))-methyltransferase RsmD [Gemmatimonadales bacterium]NIR03376.1 16S rRNA (guanine(966)-N(2))-methyltransferase RsmD [Gemmatimonadales bacterium]